MNAQAVVGATLPDTAELLSGARDRVRTEVARSARPTSTARTRAFQVGHPVRVCPAIWTDIPPDSNSSRGRKNARRASYLEPRRQCAQRMAVHHRARAQVGLGSASFSCASEHARASEYCS